MDAGRSVARALLLLLAPAFAATAAAQSGAYPSEPWTWRATVYGWFPNARATSTFETPGGGTIAVDTNPGNYLSKLQFAFMGTLEARKDPWSFVGDAIVVDFGATKSNVTSIRVPGGVASLPAPVDVGMNLKAFAGTLAAGYSLQNWSTANIGLVAGARYLRLDTGLDWNFTAAPVGLPPQGSLGKTTHLWDGVVGLRGSSDTSTNGFVTYYADIGTGSSSLTWQAFGGIGYHFNWGDAMLGYRYLAYHLRGNRPVSELSLGGPLIGVGFTF